MAGNPAREQLVEKRLAHEEEDQPRYEKQRGDSDDGALHLRRRRQEIEKTLDRIQLALRLCVQLRGEKRGRGVRRQQREELVIDRREDVLLIEQFVDRDHADDLVLDLERNGGQRPIERNLPVVQIKTVAAARDTAEGSGAELGRDVLDARNGVLAIARDRAQLLGVFIE